MKSTVIQDKKKQTDTTYIQNSIAANDYKHIMGKDAQMHFNR